MNVIAMDNNFTIGDWVVATEDNEYKFLIGRIIAIDKAGTLEHCTDNDTDDIHVDFMAFEYPPKCISEIEEYFSELYGEQIMFDDILLDDVIMAPYMLVCITHLLSDKVKSDEEFIIHDYMSYARELLLIA